MHDIFLGYGDPASAHYKSLQAAEAAEGDDDGGGDDGEGVVVTQDFNDTFLGPDHVVKAFPNSKVRTACVCACVWVRVCVCACVL